MTIVSSSPNPFLQSPRGPQKKSSEPVHQPRQPLFGHLAPSHDTYTASVAKTSPTGQKETETEQRAYRVNGLFATNERLPVKTGGLGEVSSTITKAMAKFGTPPEAIEQNSNAPERDLRVVVPYLQPNRLQDKQFNELLERKYNGTLPENPEDKDRKKLNELEKEYGAPFKPTNLTIQSKVKGKTYDFQVMQTKEPAINDDGSPDKQKRTIVYALRNDALFSNTGNIATYDSLSKASLELLTPFDEAVGKLVTYLEGKKIEPKPDETKGEVEFTPYNQSNDGGKLGFMVGNDWLTGPTLYQKEVQERKNIHKIFFMHNSYDSGAVTAEEAGYDRGWPLPTTLTKPEQLYSHLTLSLKSADAVVANKNFVKTLTQTDFGKGQPFVPALRHHLENGTIFDMHHGLDEDFRPDKNEFLRANQGNEYQLDSEKKQLDAMRKSSNGEPYQFKELIPAALSPKTNAAQKAKHWEQFKKDNKLALQTKYGLEKKSDAVVMSWAARLEPNQKGFYLVQNTIEQLLRRNEKLQILIAGNIGDPAKYGPNERMLDNWIKKVNKEFPGQVYIPNAFVSKREITQMNAGSDFTMLPSLYEPYGLTQLEAIKMGSIPLVNGVDGLRTTVSDPTIRTKPEFDFIGSEGDGQEKVWSYGQTGVMMQPFDAPKYREAIMRQQFFNILRDKVRSNQENAFKWSSNTKADFKKLHEELLENEARFVNEPDKQKAIQALAARMGKAQETTALKERDLAVLDDIEAKDKMQFINPAQEKFAKAMQRGIDMAKETDPKSGRNKISVVRENGFKFLEENHNWEEIIRSRYFPLLDAVVDPKKRGEVLEFGPPTFPRTQDAKKFAKPEASSQGFLGRTWANFKSAIYTMVYYLNVFNWFKKPGNPQSESEAASTKTSA